ncbi:MAG: hypothetical protein WCL16_01570 [bacterium]
MKKMILEGVRTGSGHAMLGVWLTIATLFAPQGVTLGQESGTPPAEQTVPSDFVTINVDNGGIEQVLNAFSRQTGKSIVIGPEVTSKVTVRLKHIRWDEALSTILKPYGYDYYLTGETIVVCSQDKLPGNAAGKTAATGQASATPVIPAEPLVTRVFTLKYLDASDVEEIIKAQLSPAGKASKLFIRSQSWKADSSMGGGAGAGGSGGSSAGAMGRLRRVAEENVLVKGKTIVVTDTATVIAGVEAMLTEVDRMPVQVLIEAKFIEVQSDLLRDIGLEFGTGATGAETPGVQAVKSTDGKNLFAAGVQQIGGTAIPANFLPQGALSSTRPFIGGLSVAFE